MKTTVRGLVVFFFMLFVAYGIAPKAQCDSLPTAQLQITGGSAGTEIAGGYALDLSAPGFSAIEPETFDATYPPGEWLPTDGSTI
ncbi:MAG: hypothetical protein ACRD1J_06760, partial [Terriglobia bacterium]